ncbi:MAG TPA: hypothetical protein VNG31_03505, partial [Candidatus Baltobacteraceae bacterium]|nr:hypothetical protein [Candidatus Baltobacteraceae bacterium]
MSSFAEDSIRSGDSESPLADDRTLEALDFAGVRDRVVAATRTARGRSLAHVLTPTPNFETVAQRQKETDAVRDLIASADLHVLPAIDTADLTQAAALGRSLGPGELRAIGDAIAAAAAAYRGVRDS